MIEVPEIKNLLDECYAKSRALLKLEPAFAEVRELLGPDNFGEVTVDVGGYGSRVYVLVTTYVDEIGGEADTVRKLAIAGFHKRSNDDYNFSKSTGLASHKLYLVSDPEGQPSVKVNAYLSGRGSCQIVLVNKRMIEAGDWEVQCKK